MGLRSRVRTPHRGRVTQRTHNSILVQVGAAGTKMNPRQKAYLDLLAHGLVAVRNLAYGDRSELCGVEADHLHNIPSLLDETNENRHVYYIAKERGLYLDRLRQMGADNHLTQMMAWNNQAWLTLSSIAGVELTD